MRMRMHYARRTCTRTCFQSPFSSARAPAMMTSRVVSGGPESGLRSELSNTLCYGIHVRIMLVHIHKSVTGVYVHVSIGNYVFLLL